MAAVEPTQWAKQLSAWLKRAFCPYCLEAIERQQAEDAGQCPHCGVALRSCEISRIQLALPKDKALAGLEVPLAARSVVAMYP